MGRRRRRTVTYDSKETRTVLGLLCLLVAFVAFLASFTDTADQNLFWQLRLWFGQATIVLAIFSANLGLLILGAELPFTSRLSVFAQFMLLILIPAFLSSFYRSKAAAYAAALEAQAGGMLGYELAFNFFADTLIFGQYTMPILGFAVLIFLPIALSMSVSKLVDLIGIFLSWLLRALKTLLAQRELITNQLEKVDLPDRAKRFGDFQRQETTPLVQNQQEQPHVEEYSLAELSTKANVAISESPIGEEGLSQSSLKYPDWQLPPISLLSPFKQSKPQDVDTQRNAKIIEQTLASFSIDAEVTDAFVGPSVVRYALSIPLGIKVSKVEGLSPTLALGLGVDSKAVRVDIIPGTTFLGVEVPRQTRDFIQIRELVEAIQADNNKRILPIPIGKDIDGKPIIADIQRMPHLLIAGATGSGKSILTNSFIISLLMHLSPDELRMILVDPKQVELSDYNGIPHLLTPVITDMDKVVNALRWAVEEMDKRYTVLRETNQSRNIEDFNRKMGFAAMPYIVIVIDEMADMMMTANRVETENAIVRLTQKARAVGIHLVLATQRPSVNVITGLIKANVPARIGMSVTSNTDSRVILDTNGAESLMGRGDLLYKDPGDNRLTRLQGPMVGSEEITRVVNFIKSQVPEVEYMTSILEDRNSSGGFDGGGDVSDDDLFSAAVKVVVNHQKGSASFLQRKLNVGFNRAARMLEEMEELGIVGPAIGSKPRDVLITDADAFLSQLKAEAS